MTVSEDDVVYERKFKEAFHVDFVTRLNRIDYNVNIQIATALDPRFKSLKSIAKAKRQEVWTLIFSRLQSEVHDNADGQDETVPKKKPKKSKFCLDPCESDEELPQVSLYVYVMWYELVHVGFANRFVSCVHKNRLNLGCKDAHLDCRLVKATCFIQFSAFLG